MIDVTYRYKGICGNLTITNPETEQRLRDLYDNENPIDLVEELSGLVFPAENLIESGRLDASQHIPAKNQLSDICISVNGHSFERIM